MRRGVAAWVAGKEVLDPPTVLQVATVPSLPRNLRRESDFMAG
jgi:hypothetical protein